MKGKAIQYMRHQQCNNNAQRKIGNNTRRVIFPCLHNQSVATTIPYLEKRPFEPTNNSIKCSPPSDAPHSPIRENEELPSQSHDERELVISRNNSSHTSIKKTSCPQSPTSVNVDHSNTPSPMKATAMQTPRSILRLPNLHQVSSENDITTISPKSSLHIFDIRETTPNTPSSHSTHPRHSHSVNCTTTPPLHTPGCPRAVTFDPQVWVHEVQPLPKKTWYTPAELEQFKKEAIETMQRRNFSLVGTGTGMILKQKERTSCVVGASAFWGNHDTVDNPSGKVVKTALIVEPHPTIQVLFERYLTHIIPNVEVTVTRDADDAWRCIQAARLGQQKPMHGFDLIVIEERLPKVNRGTTTTTMVSGSELIHRITLEEKMAKYHPRYSYLIGVSAHLKEDQLKLEMSRVDLIWGKPPPCMTKELQKSLIESVIKKRKKRI